MTGPRPGTFDGAAPGDRGALTFALAVPAAPAPSGGYPLSIFGHGLTRDRDDFLAIANSLALAGQATIATDVVFHGERSTCTGSGAYVAAVAGATTVSDDNACADPTTQKCDEGMRGATQSLFKGDDASRVTPRPASRAPASALRAGPTPPATSGAPRPASARASPVPDGVCEGGDFLRSGGVPVISGWNIFSLTNFFATRDNFRQQVIDLSQLVGTLAAPDGSPRRSRRSRGPRSI